MIRVVLPAHLRALAGIEGEVRLAPQAATQAAVLEALENRYPSLRGTLRDARTGQRRPLIRLFAGGEDLSHESPQAPLPADVAAGTEPYCIVAAIAGG